MNALVLQTSSLCLISFDAIMRTVTGIPRIFYVFSPQKLPIWLAKISMRTLKNCLFIKHTFMYSLASYSGNHPAGSAQRWKKRHFKDWSIFHRLESFRLTVTGESETCTLQCKICRLKKCANENSWQPQRQRTPKSYPFILLSKCNAEKSHLDFYYTLKYLLLCSALSHGLLIQNLS